MNQLIAHKYKKSHRSSKKKFESPEQKAAYVLTSVVGGTLWRGAFRVSRVLMSASVRRRKQFLTQVQPHRVLPKHFHTLTIRKLVVIPFMKNMSSFLRSLQHPSILLAYQQFKSWASALSCFHIFLDWICVLTWGTFQEVEQKMSNF